MKEFPLTELRPHSRAVAAADLDRICATPRGITGAWLALLVTLAVAGAVSAALREPRPISVPGTAATSAALSSDPGRVALADLRASGHAGKQP